MARLIDRDPVTGEAVWYEFDQHTEQATITHTQDVSAILDANKVAEADSWKTQRGIKNDWWKYASIPNVVWVEWKQKHGVDLFNKDHEKAVFKLLNSPEYRYLKATAKYHAG